MTVYIDDMRGPCHGMIMCHMLADSDDELHAMAKLIGVKREHHQAPPRHASHYDISLAARGRARKAGAIEITMRQAAAMSARRRITGQLGDPRTAEQWLRENASWRQIVDDNPVVGTGCEDLF